jgi:C4-dicarboxylate-specific signal transduction histidine kinase
LPKTNDVSSLHLGRVAIVGELSAALAHEINQPLAAILANTRAAQHMLENGGIDAAELRAILNDIESMIVEQRGDPTRSWPGQEGQRRTAARVGERRRR